jgi:predicted nucleic acid-binding protein
MRAYWDSSALIEACNSPPLRARLHLERGLTRTHALAEVFSTLTGGNLAFRLDADGAARTVASLAVDLDFHDLTATEVLQALKETRKRGVRGGRIHDYLHAVAAEKSGARRLLTLDRNDFNDLTKVEIEQV